MLADMYIQRTDYNGSITDTKCFGGSNDEAGYNFIATPDGGYFALGASSSNDGDVFGLPNSFFYWITKLGGYNTVKGKLFYDYNNNGVQDAGEQLFKNVPVISEKYGGFNGTNCLTGYFQYTVDTGNIATKVLLHKPYYTINPSVFNTTWDTYGHTDSINFAIVPIPGIRDLGVFLSSYRPLNPGRNNVYTLTCENSGTEVIQEAIVSLKLDSRIDISKLDSANFFRTGDTLNWHVYNIEPREIRGFAIYVKPKTPPVLNINDTVMHYIRVTPFSNDSSDIDNVDTVRQAIVSSFDPNNKLERGAGTLRYNDYVNGDYLYYTINFQNTGTDTAFNIYLKDTLSSMLDWRSFEMLSSSHDYNLQITNSNKLQWSFANIKLTDSVRNEPKSHGYVTYRVKPIKNLNVGQVINNTASIYFDYNLPVGTNTNVTRILSPLIALPIKLITFMGQYVDEKAALKWETADAVNFREFFIERSDDGNTFHDVGAVMAETSNSNVQLYNYSDDLSMLDAKSYFYRLRMVDMDGSFKYSNIVAVKKPINQPFLSIAPNPAHDNTWIMHPNENGKIIVYDFVGRIVLLYDIKKGNIRNQISLKGLSAGLYRIKWMSEMNIIDKAFMVY